MPKLFSLHEVMHLHRCCIISIKHLTHHQSTLGLDQQGVKADGVLTRYFLDMASFLPKVLLLFQSAFLDIPQLYSGCTGPGISSLLPIANPQYYHGGNKLTQTVNHFYITGAYSTSLQFLFSYFSDQHWFWYQFTVHSPVTTLTMSKISLGYWPNAFDCIWFLAQSHDYQWLYQ